MPKKLYYLTTEITPFANVSGLGDFSAKVPFALQEKGHDIRTIIPKYGYVSERKYILREVIRLRDIPFQFDGEEISASAKSAFIPKTRVQVYFRSQTQARKALFHQKGLGKLPERKFFAFNFQTEKLIRKTFEQFMKKEIKRLKI